MTVVIRVTQKTVTGDDVARNTIRQIVHICTVIDTKRGARLFKILIYS